MSETYERPGPEKRRPDERSRPGLDAPDQVRPDRARTTPPADDDGSGLSPALESEGGGENRRQTGRPAGTEGV